MEPHMRSEERHIVWKHSDQVEGVASEEAAANSSSRVFSLPNPPDERMLTFRRRSSTRVFVRKKSFTDKEPGRVNNLTRVIRSGKRLYLSEPVKKTEDNYSGELADIRWSEKNGKEETRLGEPFGPESDGNEMAALGMQGLGKMFDNVYSRKRPRNGDLNSDFSHVKGQANDPRFGVVFSRKSKNKKPEVVNDFGKVSGYQFGETEDFFRAGVRHYSFRESKNNLLETVDVHESELLTSVSDPLVLVLLSESSCDYSSVRFGRFIISIINWMRRARMNIHHLAAFLLSELMSSAFLQRGIHFLPATDMNSNFLLGSFNSNFGTCKIYSSCDFLPLISLNFLALPSYFKSLYLAALLGSQYFDFTHSTYFMALKKKLNPESQCDDCDSHVHLETDFPGTVLSSSVSATVNKKAFSAAQSSGIVARSTGILRGSRLRKLQRKRSLKLSNARKFFSMNCHSTSCSNQNSAILSSVGPLRMRELENFIDDPFFFHINKVSSTSPGSHSKLIEVAKKNTGGQMKEIKAALSDIKQNIDSVQCNANILVTAGDRCWREECAVVFLELSTSREWCLAVKIGDNLRYLQCPQDLKYTLNRFTHAHMWIIEDGWRLEFPEKLDWLTFKELHAECRQRNCHPEDSSVKVIPVPVFKDVPTYEDDRVSSFERPEQYILMKHNDEILRATVCEAPYYDMDSGDEEWLHKYNSTSSNIENGTSSFLLEYTFERMIFTFEKNAYCSSSNVLSLEREPHNHEELGSKNMVADVYDYWLTKRKQRRGPLVKVFQSLSPRKPQLMQRPVLRKRRSLKRQRSQVGRGKPVCWFNSKAKEEAKAAALLKVQKAKDAWRRSMEAAVPLRRRAQLLMENADLAAYKSVMALRIAQAIGSMPADDTSPFLDWLPEELTLS